MVSKNFIIHPRKEKKREEKNLHGTGNFFKERVKKLKIADCLLLKKMFPFLTGTGTRVSGNILEGGKWVGTF
jgi:hypothetical protein